LHVPSLELDAADAEENGGGGGNGSGVGEALFPAGKVADLQRRIELVGKEAFIGLEYVIEVQHNTIKKMQNNYTCLLCDAHIKAKNNSSVSTIDLVTSHIKGIPHRIKYITKFFPRLKNEKLKRTNNGDLTGDVVEKIVARHGFMMPRVKVVIGMKLFKRKQSEIKAVVEKSTHMREDDKFLSEAFGIRPTPKYDKYANAFDMLEQEEEKVKQPKVISKTPVAAAAKTSGPQAITGNSSKRNLDEVALPVLPSNPTVGQPVQLSQLQLPSQEQLAKLQLPAQEQLQQLQKPQTSLASFPSASKSSLFPSAASDISGKNVGKSTFSDIDIITKPSRSTPEQSASNPTGPPAAKTTVKEGESGDKRAGKETASTSGVKPAGSKHHSSKSSLHRKEVVVSDVDSESDFSDISSEDSRDSSRGGRGRSGKRSRSRSHEDSRRGETARDRRRRRRKKDRKQDDGHHHHHRDSRGGGGRSERSRSRERRAGGRSRSRDRGGGGSRRSRSPRDHRSRSPREGRRRSRSPDSPGLTSMRHVERYLDEEQLLVERMNLEKKKFMAAPELHPDYNREWERFYNYKVSHYGPMHTSYLHDEWAKVWKKYFFEVHDTNVKQERNMLMNRHKVYYSDLDRFKKKKQQQQREMEAKREEEMRHKAMREREQQRQQEQLRKHEEEKRKLLENVKQEPSSQRNRMDRSPVTAPMAPSASVSDMAPGGGGGLSGSKTSMDRQVEVSVLATLRLLTAIESDLGDLGRKVDPYLMRIVGFGNEAGKDKTGDGMLEQAAFCEFLKSCCQLLKVKLEMGIPQEQRKNVFKICIDNITILLQRARPKAPAATSATSASGPSPEMERAIKASIANKIMADFAKYGRQVFGREVQDLVEIEFQRLAKQLNGNFAALFDQAAENAATSYQTPAANPAPVTVTLEDQPDVDVKPVIGAGINASILDQIDWNEIQNAINMSSGKNPANQNTTATSPPGNKAETTGASAAGSGGNSTASPGGHDRATALQAGTSTATTAAAGAAGLSGNSAAAESSKDPNKSAAENSAKETSAAEVVVKKEVSAAEAAAGGGGGGFNSEFDELTIEELASLFKNFKTLQRSIQESLIDYMKKLEKSNPTKVTELKRQIHS